MLHSLPSSPKLNSAYTSSLFHTSCSSRLFLCTSLLSSSYPPSRTPILLYSFRPRFLHVPPFIPPSNLLFLFSPTPSAASSNPLQMPFSTPQHHFSVILICITFIPFSYKILFLLLFLLSSFSQLSSAFHFIVHPLFTHFLLRSDPNSSCSIPSTFTFIPLPHFAFFHSAFSTSSPLPSILLGSSTHLYHHLPSRLCHLFLPIVPPTIPPLPSQAPVWFLQCHSISLES